MRILDSKIIRRSRLTVSDKLKAVLLKKDFKRKGPSSFKKLVGNVCVQHVTLSWLSECCDYLLMVSFQIPFEITLASSRPSSRETRVHFDVLFETQNIAKYCWYVAASGKIWKNKWNELQAEN
jgi:hypothetical protein